MGTRELKAGALVGTYRLVRELGRGGMANVYLAERADGEFEQQVALKLIKRGLDTDEVQRRFLIERQILASLQHPNIARLLDGGVSDDDRPFFAMERIDGERLDQYADQRRLSIEDRLRLFVRVAQAVQAAHQQLVVHRDIKPSNILVTADGVPKLLDFGIAKLLSPELDQHTRSSVRPATPEFASPEQVRGEAITTATDVYQLGVLLYLLLTGTNPHTTHARTVPELKIAVCESDPKLPSTTVTRSPSTTKASVAAVPSVCPDRFPRRLRGDLDVIILKAMRKVPSERYASVGQLVDDIERHLVGRPISARRATLTYRARRFVARHKLAVSAAAALVGLSIFYTAWVTVERGRAQRAAARAEQTVAALENLLGDFDPYTARGGQLTVRELLDRSVSNIERNLARQPEVQVRLRTLLGGLFHKLGAYDPAREILEQALAESETIYGPEHQAVGRAALGLGTVLAAQNRFRDGRALLERALVIFEQSLRSAAGDPAAEHSLAEDLAETLGRLTRMTWVFGEHDRALELSFRALEIQESVTGPRHLSMAAFLLDRADVYLAMKDPASAVPLLRRAVLILGAAEGDHGARLAQALTVLGRALARNGSGEEALAVLKKARALSKTVLGDQHPDTAMVLLELGTVLGALGEHEDSRVALQRSAEICREVYGENSPTSLRVTGKLAEQLDSMGLYGESRRLYERLLASLEKSLGSDSPHLFPTMVNLARSVRLSGDHSAALALYRRAFALLNSQPSADLEQLDEILRTIASLQIEIRDELAPDGA